MEKRYLYTLKEVIFSLRTMYLDDESKKEMLTQIQKKEDIGQVSFFRPADNQVKSLSDNGIVTFNSDNISVSSINNSGLPELLYLPSRDILTLTESGPNFKITEFAINYLMNMMFFYSHFSPYHLTLLQSSSIKDKKLVLEKFDPCPKIDFYIKEDDECIKLTKIPKSKC